MNNFNRENSAWCITDGSAGMISQVKGLSQAMNLEFTLKEVKVNFPWNILPVGIIPIMKSTFTNFSEFSENIPPKFIISCGRKSVYLSLFLKRKFKEKVVTIHIQNPKSKHDEFDLIISPKHDNLKLANTFATSLAINHISESLIREEMDKFSHLINKDDTPICTILIGGKSNNYIFDNNEVDQLIKKIKKIKENQEIKFFFLFSRRTERNTINRINSAFTENEIIWSDKKVNPYIALLGFSKYIICTSDSVSMISEAISAMKPVYIFRLQSSKSNNRIENFNDYVILEGLARKLDDKLEEFKHDYTNETDIIAEKIKNKFK